MQVTPVSMIRGIKCMNKVTYLTTKNVVRMGSDTLSLSCMNAEWCSYRHSCVFAFTDVCGFYLLSVLPQGLVEAKKQLLVQNDKSEEHLLLQERVRELSSQLTQVQEDKEQIQQGKVRFHSMSYHCFFPCVA
jgi:hypothetical protein